MSATAGTAGYSGRALDDKLGIKPGVAAVVLGAPAGFTIAGTGRRLRPDLDLIVAFFKRRADLEARWSPLTQALTPAGALWVAWPKKASGVATDITENVVREIALPTGWVDTKVCAIDETWSGLKCVLRREHRPAGHR